VSLATVFISIWQPWFGGSAATSRN